MLDGRALSPGGSTRWPVELVRRILVRRVLVRRVLVVATTATDGLTIAEGAEFEIAAGMVKGSYGRAAIAASFTTGVACRAPVACHRLAVPVERVG